MDREPDLLALGPEAILSSIMDRVVDAHSPVVAGLENDSTRSRSRSSPGTPPPRGASASCRVFKPRDWA
jgi:magnesium transporter